MLLCLECAAVISEALATCTVLGTAMDLQLQRYLGYIGLSGYVPLRPGYFLGSEITVRLVKEKHLIIAVWADLCLGL